MSEVVAQAADKAPNKVDKRPLYIFGLVLLIAYLLVAFMLHDRMRETIIQNKLDDLNHHLLYQKALRSYISNELKPVVFNLQKEHILSGDYFEPKAQSSTYISKSIFNIYHQLLTQSGLHSWEYRLAAKNPMNLINTATKPELKLLEAFNNNRNLTKFERIETVENHETLYVAIPLGENKKECLRCHGDPKDAPKDLIAYYGDKNGFNESAGMIRGFISYRINLDDAMQGAKESFLTINALLITFTLLIFALVSWVYISEQRRKLLGIALQQETNYIAHHDFLTQLNNRHSLNKHLPKLLESLSDSSEENNQLWAMMIDIDHFKLVNDTYGHDIGDLALKRLAEILKTSIEDINQAKTYRLGGEEFLVLLPQGNEKLVQQLFDNIQLALNHTTIEGLNTIIFISAGATIYQHPEKQYDFLRRSDQALYKAKEQGRSRLIIENPNINNTAES